MEIPYPARCLFSIDISVLYSHRENRAETSVSMPGYVCVISINISPKILTTPKVVCIWYVVGVERGFGEASCCCPAAPDRAAAFVRGSPFPHVSPRKLALPMIPCPTSLSPKVMPISSSKNEMTTISIASMTNPCGSFETAAWTEKTWRCKQ